MSCINRKCKDSYCAVCVTKNHMKKDNKRRVRHKPSSSTVMPDKRIRTDILKQIQADNYVSEAGVDYDKEAIDELLRIRHEKKARLKNAKALREYEKYERLKQDGKIIDESLESTLTEREVNENFDDCLF